MTSFTSMDTSTAEQWAVIGVETAKNQGRVADRVLAMLRSLADITDGFSTDQLTHCLQTATLAERAGERVTVVDFKTARRPPASLAEVPEATLRQMAAYVAALEAIYPGRAVRAAAPRERRSNSCGSTSSEMPGPSSRTTSHACLSSLVTPTSMSPSPVW